MIHFHTNPSPTGDTAIDEEIQSLQRIVRMTAQRHQGAMLRMKRTGNEKINELFSPQARGALDKLYAYAYQHEFNLQPESIKKKWLSLHDAFQDVPLGMESPVGIFGLKSPKGMQLNDTIGTSYGKIGTGKNEGRFSVRTVMTNEEGAMVTEDLWIKMENLKTVYGTCRSNVFPSGLFEKSSRINHSCCPNATMLSVERLNQDLDNQLPPNMRLAPGKPNEYAIIPVREIQAGEEVTLSYLGPHVESRSTEARRETLREKYRFTCECEACKRNELC